MSVIDNSNLGTLWNRILGLFTARKINNKSLAKDITINDEDIPSTAVSGETTVEGALGNLVDQISDQSQQIDDLVLKPSTAFSIPASGGSVSYNLAGLTASHELARWNFSSSAENDPPVDLTWYTYNGYFTITNTSGSTSETIQPVFVLPELIATTAHS